MKSNKTDLTIAAMAILALAATSANAALLFYEGFEYSSGSTLDGLGTPGGGDGTWFDNSSGTGAAPGSGQPMTVRDNGTSGGQLWTGIPSGGFPQTGGFLEGERRNDNSGHIQLATSVTSTFLDDATTWMSFVAGPALATDQPDNHHKPNLAIGQGELMDDRAQQANGQAIGGGARYNTQGVSAAYWDDEDSSGNFEEHRSGTKGRIMPQQLIVIKIEWGAASDTVSVANFDISIPYTTLTEADFDAASPVSITSVNNFDQSTFNTISFHGSRSNFDEIRIATTFEDVVTGTELIDLGEDPTNGDTVGIDLGELGWVLPDSNDLVNGIVTCDVWFVVDDDYPEAGLFAGDPNFTNYATKIVGDPDPEAVQSVAIPNLPLLKGHTYYWRIDTYDDSTVEPQPVIGPVFTFNTNNQTPGVDIVGDDIVWLTEGSVSVPLSGVITDTDGPDDPPSLQWYIDDVPVEGATTEDIDVTLTATGDFVVRLTADDGVDIGEDTVTITVYSDSCAAALGQGATLLQTDFNGDCVTDFADLAVFAGEFLDSIAL